MGALEIIEAAVTQDLTTLATAKMELNETGSTNDNKISMHITQASSQIAAYCNRRFGLETVREHFNISFTRTLTLRRRPVVEVLEVKDMDSIIDPVEYTLDAERGILYRKAPVFFATWGTETVVTYDAGYDLLDDLPEALEKACLILVRQYFFESGSDPSLRAESIPGVADYTYGSRSADVGTLPSDVRVLIDPFIDLGIA